jgi:hypothetical protein
LNRFHLEDKVLEALAKHGGRARLVEVAKYIWVTYEPQLRASGDYFYLWRYEMRQAATKLRKVGKLKPDKVSKPFWEIA